MCYILLYPTACFQGRGADRSQPFSVEDESLEFQLHSCMSFCCGGSLPSTSVRIDCVPHASSFTDTACSLQRVFMGILIRKINSDISVKIITLLVMEMHCEDESFLGYSAV
jgi:hypothetical protein